MFYLGEAFQVSLRTLEQGTDGEIKIKLIGTLGESQYLPLGDKGFFSEAQ